MEPAVFIVHSGLSGAQYSQIIRIFDIFISRNKMLYGPHRNIFITPLICPNYEET